MSHGWVEQSLGAALGLEPAPVPWQGSETPSPIADPNYVGHAVENGVIRFFSVSSLKKGDPKSLEGCPRAYFRRYVDRVKEPQKDSAAESERYHGETSHFLTTGEKRVSAIVSRGLHVLPAPGPDLLVEQEISGAPKLSRPVVFAAGIPLLGKVDLAHRRGVNVGCSDIEDTIELPNTAEVADHKFVSSFDRNLAPIQLPRDIQMAGYGQWAVNVWPDVERVRLSHHYFHKKKNTPAIKVSTVVDRRVIEENWNSVEGLARLLVDIARFKGDWNQVEANTKACGAYGGCHYATNGCAAFHAHSRDNSLTQLFGAMAVPMLQPPELQQMSNVTNNDPALAQQQALQAQLAQAQASQVPPQPAYQLPQGFVEAISVVNGVGMGWPALTGEAAATFAYAHQIALPPEGFPATGQFAAIAAAQGTAGKVLHTVADVIQIASELRAFKAPAPPPAPHVPTYAPPPVAPPVIAAPAAVPALVSPETPASNPALAATPMPFAAPQAPVNPAQSFVPFGVPQAPIAPAPVQQTMAPVTAAQPAPAPAAVPLYVPPAAPAEAPKKRGKKAAAAATTTTETTPAPGAIAVTGDIDALAEAIAAKVFAKFADAIIEAAS